MSHTHDGPLNNLNGLQELMPYGDIDSCIQVNLFLKANFDSYGNYNWPSFHVMLSLHLTI